jgi:uncharacterized protein (UPF0332 family)
MKCNNEIGAIPTTIYFIGKSACAEALLASEGLSYSTHKGVISAFGEKFVKTGRLPAETHQWLREAFDQRIIGDYRWEVDLSTPDMRVLLSHARIFKNQVIALLESNTPPPTAYEPPAVYGIKIRKPKKVKPRKRK